MHIPMDSFPPDDDHHVEQFASSTDSNDAELSVASDDNQDAEPPVADEATPSAVDIEATEQQSSAEEVLLPPEAQRDANGGPLGCCLGVTIGLLLSLSIVFFSYLGISPLRHLLGGELSIMIRVLLVIVAIAAVIICGRAGWQIGKKAYREYEVPTVKE